MPNGLVFDVHLKYITYEYISGVHTQHMNDEMETMQYS